MKSLLILSFLAILSCDQHSAKAQPKGGDPDTLALFKEYIKVFREIKDNEYPLLINPFTLSFKPWERLDKFWIFRPFGGYPKVLPLPKVYYPIVKVPSGSNNRHAFICAHYEILNDTLMSIYPIIDLFIFNDSGKMMSNYSLGGVYQKHQGSDDPYQYGKISLDEDGSIVTTHYEAIFQHPDKPYDPKENRLIKWKGTKITSYKLRKGKLIYIWDIDMSD
jgi:hypothetical protein